MWSARPQWSVPRQRSSREEVFDLGLLLIIIGLILWLLTTLNTLGLILLIIGLVLLFVPGVPYGYSDYRRRRL